MAGKLQVTDTASVYDHPVSVVWLPLVKAAYFAVQEAGRQVNANPQDVVAKAVSDVDEELDEALDYCAKSPVSSSDKPTDVYKKAFLSDVKTNKAERAIAKVFRTTTAKVRAAEWASFVQIATKGTLLSGDAVAKIMSGSALPPSTANKKSTVPAPPKKAPAVPAPPTAPDFRALPEAMSTTTMLLLGLGGLALIYWFTQQKGTAPAATPAAATGG